jgi:enamine deaminase RidA (YjgF/YER057c/UK114 family)
MDRQAVGTSGPYAAVVGYSRAVRVGNHIFVAGTAPLDAAGNVVAPGDPYRQAKHCLSIIVDALKQLGAAPEDVVRTRLFVKNPDDWQQIGKAHGELFASIRPAATMVIAQLVHPDMLCEIEAEAVIGG